MMNDLQKARKTLETGNYTCVTCHADSIYTSMDRGVAPLLYWLENGISLTNFSAADRVVGRATAFLYVLLGVKEVYARVMSKPAADVLASYGIFSQADILVDSIINRKGDGPCPFEAAVMDIHDAHQALTAIQAKRTQLRKENRT